MKNIIFILALIACPSLFASVLRCHGTEPFWSAFIDTDEARVHMNMIGLPEQVYTGTIQPAAGATIAYAFSFQGQEPQGRQILLNVVETKNCNDGMSDDIFPYVIMINQAQTLVGCCR